MHTLTAIRPDYSLPIFKIACLIVLALLLATALRGIAHASMPSRPAAHAQTPTAPTPPQANYTCDVLVVGGGAGGTAAALAAARNGATVCLLVETDWLGGQLTAQGVSTPDENRFIEQFGGTATYDTFRQGVRDYYRKHYHLKAPVSADPHFNPGDSWAGGLSYEPKVGAAVLRAMVQPLVASGRLQIFYRTHAITCDLDPETGARITGVTAQQETGTQLHFTPRYVLDATDQGDVLALSGREGVDWVAGAESHGQTGEPDAPAVSRLDWMQPLTFPFALDWSPATRATNLISRPADYDHLKATQHYSVRYGAINGTFQGTLAWWTYRRILAAANFDDPRITSDISMINTPGNDFDPGDLLHMDAAERQAVLERARQAALGYIYWLQTECPREDDPTGRRRGYPELRLRRDIFDTPDGLSPLPYIRESRRLLALETVREQEIVAQDFSGHPWQAGARAAFMPDSVGIGYYALDIHANAHGEPAHYAPTRPFQIPLGALIPVRLENLLAAAKDLGTTHLTNGAYRLHPVEWNIGEAAGALAAFCVRTGATPRQVAGETGARQALQQQLLRDGMPLYWFTDVPPGHPAFAAVQWLAMADVPLADSADLEFHPDRRITAQEWRAWRQAVANTAQPTFTGTRAQAALLLYNHLTGGVVAAGSLAPTLAA